MLVRPRLGRLEGTAPVVHPKEWAAIPVLRPPDPLSSDHPFISEWAGPHLPVWGLHLVVLDRFLSMPSRFLDRVCVVEAAPLLHMGTATSPSCLSLVPRGVRAVWVSALAMHRALSVADWASGLRRTSGIGIGNDVNASGSVRRGIGIGMGMRVSRRP